MNLAPVGSLRIFGNQYIKFNFLEVFAVSFNVSSPFDFCVYGYVDVEFFLLFGVTFANSLKMLYFLNATLFDAL